MNSSELRFDHQRRGSQRHIQAYVNTPDLTSLIDSQLMAHLAPLAEASIDWVSPLSSESYDELQDAKFWPAIGHSELQERASNWWPSRGGPSWDAVALARRDGESDVVVLVEAKANVPEFTAGVFGAKDPNSIRKIEAALDEARLELGASGSLEDWKGLNYQLANRLTWALWLRTQGVEAALAYVLFSDDQSHIPTSEAELHAATEASHAKLGVPESAIDPWCCTVVLAAAN